MLSHVSVHSGVFCLRHRARDLISVPFFDRVDLFSDFNHLFEFLNQVLLPIAVKCLLYIGIKCFLCLIIKLQNILKTLTVNFMSNFHVGNACFPYKTLE